MVAIDPRAGDPDPRLHGADATIRRDAAPTRSIRGPVGGKVGYCRAIRAGDHVFVTGTVPVEPDGSVHGKGDAYRSKSTRSLMIEMGSCAVGACGSRQADRVGLIGLQQLPFRELFRSELRIGLGWVDVTPATAVDLRLRRATATPPACTTCRPQSASWPETC